MHPVVRAILQSAIAKGKAYFDGNGDYLTLADSVDWNFGSGDFSIEIDVTPIADTNIAGSSWCFNMMYGRGYTSSYKPMWMIVMSKKNSIVSFYWNNMAAGISGTQSITFGQAYRIKVQRIGNMIYLYVNDVLLTSTAISYTFSSDANAIRINYAQDGDGSDFGTFYFNNYLNKIKIVKVATIVLDIQFNEPVGATTFIDETGKTVTTHGNVVIVA
jgi:hypothetical protein